MKLTKEQVEKLAHLARLEFTEEQKESMLNDMDNILGFVEKINGLNLEGIDPLIYMSDEVNVLRKDEVKQETSKDDALKNAPSKDTDYFKVPKIINRGEE
ncbi:MAG: Asp-tRNA(Asn)/Glu-tRNA(Gln) amidotransferase GatCAB subunit C [Owenweeksia sp.]|nr:Asp-tRNA(Asn)/Glu-tRNA(Gln) amidotransferase GatCAB subunit C [Owenweeksia sp.]